MFPFEVPITHPSRSNELGAKNIDLKLRRKIWAGDRNSKVISTNMVSKTNLFFFKV